MANIKAIAAKALALFGAGAIVCAAGNATAYAQFQSVFGGGQSDVSQGGVIQAADGDFVSVGYSASFSNTTDVYVVKSDRCGDLVWAQTYDFGSTDIGHKIRQTSDGGYIIVGETHNVNNRCTGRDAFLLKIRSDGSVDWAKTYGGSRSDIGTDVALTTNGFIFAGATSSAGAGSDDAWLTSTDANGNIIWSRVYGGENIDGFRSIDFACGGRVIAAGYTRSHSNNGDYDVFVASADAATGILNWSNHYGSSTRDEQARSVEAYGSDLLYIAGFADVTTGGIEGYIIKARCGGGEFLADITYGGNGTTNEDQFTEIKALPTGNLIVSGYMMLPPDGFGDRDAWLTEIDPNLVAIWSHIYGGTRADMGWSVAVANPQAAQHSLIMSGSTESFGFGLEDLYEVFTDISGRSGCNERRVKLQRSFPGYMNQGLSSGNPEFWAECDARATSLRNDRYQNICTPCAPLNKKGEEGMDLGDNGSAVGSIRSADAVAERQLLDR